MQTSPFQTDIAARMLVNTETKPSIPMPYSYKRKTAIGLFGTTNRLPCLPLTPPDIPCFWVEGAEFGRAGHGENGEFDEVEEFDGDDDALARSTRMRPSSRRTLRMQSLRCTKRLIPALSLCLTLNGCVVGAAVDLAATTILTAGKLVVKGGAVIDAAIPDGKKTRIKEKRRKRAKKSQNRKKSSIRKSPPTK